MEHHLAFVFTRASAGLRELSAFTHDLGGADWSADRITIKPNFGLFSRPQIAPDCGKVFGKGIMGTFSEPVDKAMNSADTLEAYRELNHSA